MLVNGLHPETKDDVVMRYLDAHGKVCRTEPVIHHVYQNGPLKGIKDGTRSYMVNITKPLGSYHIIDDTKVSIRYRGQSRTCAKCHKSAFGCPGNGMAKDCTADRIFLSDAMKSHWEEIGFVPDKSVGYDITEEEGETLVQIGKSTHDEKKDVGSFDGVYCGIKVVGTDFEENLDELHALLTEYGLPQEKNVEDPAQFGRTVQIKDIDSEVCKTIVKNVFNKNLWAGQKKSIKLVTKPLSSDSEDDYSENESCNVDTLQSNANEADMVQNTPVNLSKRNLTELTPSSSEKKREKKRKKQKEKASEKDGLTISSIGSVSNRRGRSSNQINP